MLAALHGTQTGRVYELGTDFHVPPVSNPEGFDTDPAPVFDYSMEVIAASPCLAGTTSVMCTRILDG